MVTRCKYLRNCLVFLHNRPSADNAIILVKANPFPLDDNLPTKVGVQSTL